MDNIKKVEVYQTYLKCSNDQKIQIRKRGINGDYIYYQTRVRMQNDQLLQVEKRLTEAEYNEKLLEADPTRKQFLIIMNLDTLQKKIMKLYYHLYQYKLL